MNFEVLFLGSGSAFTIDNYQSNVLLTFPSGKRMLIDCGTDARRALAEHGLSYKDIDAVYVSHLHSDHVGGLEWLGFCSFFDPSCAKPKLFIHDSLVDELWSTTLAGGMASLEGQKAHLDTYFDVNRVAKNKTFTFEDVSFQPVQVVHVVSEFSVEPAFGLMFKLNNTNIFFTSDAQYAPSQIKAFYDQADVIYQDCEVTPFKSGVHAHFSDLKTLPDATKDKMWLYHCQDKNQLDAEGNGFKGFVQKGQKFMF